MEVKLGKNEGILEYENISKTSGNWVCLRGITEFNANLSESKEV